MAQDATTLPPTGFGKIQVSDFIKSLGLAAGANLLLSLYTIIDSGGWPTTEDWQDILRTTIAFILAYIIKNALTNNVGQFAQKDKPVVKVDAEQLQDVIEEAKGQA
jgi:hypothetical protein